MACLGLKKCIVCGHEWFVDIYSFDPCPKCEAKDKAAETIKRLQKLSELTQLSQDLGMYDL